VIRVALCAFVGLLCATSANAETVRLEYEASVLNLVTLGRAGISARIDASAYAADGSVATSGLAALFDDTRITVRAGGRVSGAALGWTRYDLEHAYARKSRNVAMRRAGAQVTSTITPRFGDMGSPPASAAQQAASHDPLTALLAMSRAIGRGRICAGAFPVFDGRQHYQLVLSPAARGRYRGGGYDGEAIVCALRYRPVSGFKPMSAEERARIPEARIWFADPAVAGFAAPLRITVPTPLGEGRIDVKRFEVRP